MDASLLIPNFGRLELERWIDEIKTNFIGKQTNLEFIICFDGITPSGMVDQFNDSNKYVAYGAYKGKLNGTANQKDIMLDEYIKDLIEKAKKKTGAGEDLTIAEATEKTFPVSEKVPREKLREAIRSQMRNAIILMEGRMREETRRTLGMFSTYVKAKENGCLIAYLEALRHAAANKLRNKTQDIIREEESF